MSVVIVSVSLYGQTHYVRDANDGAVNWCENVAEAKEFADGAAADAFMSGKTNLTYSKTTVGGIVHFGKKTHA